MSRLFLVAVFTLLATSAHAEDWALRLDYGAQVEFPFHEAFDTDLTATVEAWVRADPDATGQFAAYSRWSHGVEDKSLWIDKSTNRVSAYYAYSPWRIFSPVGAFAFDGEWHHVAYVRNAADASFRIYIDGVMVAEQTGVTGSVGVRPVITSVGFWRDGNTREAVSGYDIRELHVSDEALYTGTFSPAWNLTSGPATVLHVLFDEGAGTSIRDSGPVGMSGQITERGPDSNARWIRVDTVTDPLPVTFGPSWDGISLQEILDAEYGAGTIDVETDFEGAQAGDALVPYWLDDTVDGWMIREVADFASDNVLGWYAETLAGPPAIDGVDDGVIFDGSGSEGETAFVGLAEPTRFGLYLNPNGSGDGTNAPEPEIFFTNRAYNDEGPDGTGAIHPPEGGDPQALIFNITHLRDGVPTYVVAWEDIDSGSELRDTYAPGYTDNDYNDLVVEIQASSPVRTEESSWGEVKSRFGQ